MEHTVHSTGLGEWPPNMNNEAKEHWIRKGSSTSQLKDLSFEKSQQFHKQIGSLGFELALKDYLLAVTFLVPLSSKTRFVIQRPKGKSTAFIASYLEEVKIAL